MRQDLKDRNGRRIGYIEDRGTRKEIYDAVGLRASFREIKSVLNEYRKAQMQERQPTEKLNKLLLRLLDYLE